MFIFFILRKFDISTKTTMLHFKCKNKNKIK